MWKVERDLLCDIVLVLQWSQRGKGIRSCSKFGDSFCLAGLFDLFWFFPPSSEGMQFAFGSASLLQFCEGKEEM